MARKRLSWTFSEANQGLLQTDVDVSFGQASSIRRIGPSDLDVVFQPIVDLRDGSLFAVEALTRCRWPEFGNPIYLFEQAVADHFTGRLGRAVREVTFQRVQGKRVFVNVHPAELTARWLVRPDDPLCFHDDEVYLEVTETAAFEFHDLCSGVLKEVCTRTGAKLVIDDFGAGYSNLERIIDLEPDVVKLDLALIRDIDANPRRRTLVSHVVALCIETGASVVAEGIETESELAVVCDVGAHYGQGYLLARPAYPVPEINWPR